MSCGRVGLYKCIVDPCLEYLTGMETFKVIPTD